MYRVKGSIWIEGNEGTFIGYGRAMLLEGIKKHGSIAEAAKAMQMSYRQAWELIDNMNKQSKTSLVEKLTGGVGGGGTKLTKEGEEALKCFLELHNKFKKFNTAATKKLKF